MARPREHGEHRRRDLLDAAGRLLREEGAGGLSVRRVAEEVDTTTRAIYSLFGSKAGLVRGLYREGFETLDEHLRSVGRSGDPRADLGRLGMAYRAAARAQPDRYRVMFGRPVPEFRPDEDDVELSLRSLNRLRSAVERCVDEGVLSGEVEALTLQLWALVHGLAELELTGALGGEDAAEQHWREALAAAARGYA